MADMKQDLINRLNGIYVTKVDDGAGLLNGKDTFTREFPVPPICKEAAIFIEAQEAEIKRLREALEFYAKGKEIIYIDRDLGVMENLENSLIHKPLGFTAQASLNKGE